MEEQVVQRTGQHPRDYLMDGGFATRQDITTLEQREVTVYAPVKLPRNKPEAERYQPRYGDEAPWQKMCGGGAKYEERGRSHEERSGRVGQAFHPK